MSALGFLCVLFYLNEHDQESEEEGIEKEVS